STTTPRREPEFVYPSRWPAGLWGEDAQCWEVSGWGPWDGLPETGVVVGLLPSCCCASENFLRSWVCARLGHTPACSGVVSVQGVAVAPGRALGLTEEGLCERADAPAAPEKESPGSTRPPPTTPRLQGAPISWMRAKAHPDSFSDRRPAAHSGRRRRARRR